ncbi:MAG: YicC family protein [Candidatus Hydrogenedentes bacterium]|nr:YicC family protein [Candidatus Hydrogenedentota bacterium]
MLCSMTGFGRATCEFDNSLVSIELTSVNHRYLDPTIRLPHEWAALDAVLRDALKRGLSRGKINLVVNRKRQPGSSQTLRFAPEVARGYVEAAKELRALLGTDEALSLNTVTQFNGVFYYEDDAEDLEEAKNSLLAGLDEALGHLNTMRAAEGESLRKDLTERIHRIRQSLAAIEERLPELGALYEQRLRDRLRELTEESGMPEERIALEVAIMAERGDVTEEVVRLKTHLDLADELFDHDEPVGRKLNFLTQEIQREINTLGSKVRDSDVTRQVLDMKSELEKIREQVQNVE